MNCLLSKRFVWEITANNAILIVSGSRAVISRRVRDLTQRLEDHNSRTLASLQASVESSTGCDDWVFRLYEQLVESTGQKPSGWKTPASGEARSSAHVRHRYHYKGVDKLLFIAYTHLKKHTLCLYCWWRCGDVSQRVAPLDAAAWELVARYHCSAVQIRPSALLSKQPELSSQRPTIGHRDRSWGLFCPYAWSGLTPLLAFQGGLLYSLAKEMRFSTSLPHFALIPDRYHVVGD